MSCFGSPDLTILTIPYYFSAKNSKGLCAFFGAGSGGLLTNLTISNNNIVEKKRNRRGVKKKRERGKKR